jgi:DNA mismatch repair protein MutS2
MSSLYEKSLSTLELDRVLELLAGCAVSDEAKDRCRKLRPLSDADDIRELLAQTSAAVKLTSMKGSPSFRDVKDVSGSLSRADRGGSLSPAELLRIAGVLRAARGVKEYADGEGVGDTCLNSLFYELTANRYLEEKITTAILSEEEIADAASPQLADIRRHMRVQSAKIRESLQKIISSPTYAKYLREPIITMRSDRYVVPVRSEYKNAIPGLVHDVSSSGGTFFVEPMQAVNANNALRELLSDERKEIERILAELSAECAAHRENINSDYETLVALDVIFARGRLSDNLRAMEPKLRTDGVVDLKRARHPLIDPKQVVPTTVRLGSDFDTLVITGPNTGGKTVTLKTIGLLTLMAECGLHIPADEGSTVSVFDRVLADVGDEQSIEQSLSTFSSHMKNIVEILDQCDSSTLVLFDELGAGTDPAEGAALAIAIIEFCRKMGSKVAATTHYAELKVYAMRTDRVINASCEFDVETLRPTYRLLIGVPGKSNAFAISRRLGLSEDIITSARNMVSENDLDFEDVLNQLEQQRQAMEQARQEAERLRLETEKTKKQSEEYYAQIKKERDKAVQKAKADAQHIIDDARATANQVYDELKKLRKQMKDAADAQGINEKQADLRRSLNEAEAKLGGEKQVVERPKPTREIKVGDTVELLKLGTKASVLSIAKDGTMQLQAGIMKVSAKPDEVYLLENQPQPEVKRIIERSNRELRTMAASPELDIRGMTGGEAMGVIDVFLDNAMMANLESVRIIHGKGTGALRKAVHTHLKKSRYVKSFRLGVYGEGEDGVTIVEMKK